MGIYYVSIGNSDDKLTQARWSDFERDLLEGLDNRGHIHGHWYSSPRSPYQNMCVCVELPSEVLDDTRLHLRMLADRYQQNWVAFARAENEVLTSGGVSPDVG